MKTQHIKIGEMQLKQSLEGNMQYYIRKDERSKINYLSSHHKKLEE